MIISHVTSTSKLWNEMISPPVLVSKGNVMIGYNPIYEYAALPDVKRIVSAINRSVSTKHERVEAAVTSPEKFEAAPEDRRLYTPKVDMSKGRAQNITVPI